MDKLLSLLNQKDFDTIHFPKKYKNLIINFNLNQYRPHQIYKPIDFKNEPLPFLIKVLSVLKAPLSKVKHLISLEDYNALKKQEQDVQHHKNEIRKLQREIQVLKQSKDKDIKKLSECERKLNEQQKTLKKSDLMVEVIRFVKIPLE